MKKLYLVLMGTFTLISALAQDNVSKHALFHFSFAPPLSTNGIKANEYSNAASFSLLVGLSKNEEHFSFAGLANVISNDASGFQFAGLSSVIGNNGKGMLFSGLANITRNSYHGFQFAGVVNYAKEINGFQFAGVVNIAQKVNGVQLGLLNIAEENDCPIGIINIVKKNREMGVALTYDFLGNSTISFRSGAKYTYGIFGVGYNHKTKGNKLVQEAGVGNHIICCKWFQINNELKVITIGSMSENPAFNVGYSLLPSIKIRKHYNLFGGVSPNYLTSKNDIDLFPKNKVWKNYTAKRLQQVYIGYQIGIQYII